ncbi:YjbF family lipoprotein [Pacificibacter maritimus]|nr:YjbF family lipoprotein [Pacificibacter maritimus]
MRNLTKAVTVISLCALLAACGNDKQARRGADTVKELALLAKSRLSGKKAEPTAQPDPVAMINAVLNEIPNAPLQFVLVEKTGGFAVTSIYGTNGNKVTWISPDRKSMTLESGVLTATRGFGGDLMSVEDGGAAALIASRSSGQAQKVYRFLNGEDETARFIVNCTIAQGERDVVTSGEITAATNVMTERCQSNEGFDFTNTYWIDDNRRMVQSVQWAGAGVGQLVFRRLRY